jgi:hypothetical protein
MTFREFAIDTAYRCGWTFVQALLSCMTFGQAIIAIDWKGSLLIAAGAVVYVLLKQVGIWCKEHIANPDDMPVQYMFNNDSFEEMMGVEHEDKNEVSE